MAAPKKLTDQERQEISRLHENGTSFAALALRYKVHPRTISRICNPSKYDVEKKRNIEYNKRTSEKVFQTRTQNQRYYKIVLTKALDGDVIDHLDAKDNVNRYLVNLIRQDMDTSK